MTTFTWTIRKMYAAPVSEGYTDVVIVANWLCIANNGTNSAQQFGNASFPPPSGSFTPYVDLTQEQVLEWCWANGVDKNLIESQLLDKLNQQANPPVVPLPLPW